MRFVSQNTYRNVHRSGQKNTKNMCARAPKYQVWQVFYESKRAFFLKVLISDERCAQNAIKINHFELKVAQKSSQAPPELVEEISKVTWTRLLFLRGNLKLNWMRLV